MNTDLMPLVLLGIQLISGAICGAMIGRALEQTRMGPAHRVVAGAVGGGIFGTLVMALVEPKPNIDIDAVMGSLIGGGTGGAIMTVALGSLLARIK